MILNLAGDFNISMAENDLAASVAKIGTSRLRRATHIAASGRSAARARSRWPQRPPLRQPLQSLFPPSTGRGVCTRTLSQTCRSSCLRKTGLWWPRCARSHPLRKCGGRHPPCAGAMPGRSAVIVGWPSMGAGDAAVYENVNRKRSRPGDEQEVGCGT